VPEWNFKLKLSLIGVINKYNFQCLNLEGVTITLDVSYQFKAQSDHLYELVTQFKDFDTYQTVLTAAGRFHWRISGDPTIPKRWDTENECISLFVLSAAWVMRGQWENECISLSVLSVAWVMIAQWENECISLCVLSVGRGHDSSVGE